MIFGDELKAWLADRQRQQGSRAASDGLAAGWPHWQVHSRITAAMSGPEAPSAEAVAERVRKLFADDSWLDALIAQLAEPAAADPFFLPPFRHINSDIHSGLIVYEDENVSIAAGVSQAPLLAAKKNRPRGALSIAFSGQLTIMKFVKAGGARLSFWEIEPITADFTAATAGHCRRTGARQVEDGETVAVDGRRESFVIEHAAANILVLQATVKPDRAPLSV